MSVFAHLWRMYERPNCFFGRPVINDSPDQDLNHKPMKNLTPTGANRMLNLFNTANRREPWTTTRHALLASVIVGTLALPLITHADQQKKNEHRHYRLVDLGTFGGPSSGTGNFYLQFINN